MNESPTASTTGTGAAVPEPAVVPESPGAVVPEPPLARSRPLRALYAGLGLVCVGLGAVGVVLPGWPTTVWLLVAAFFFARSSPRFYAWLLRHRLFGPLVRDVREGRGMPLRAKVWAVGMIVVFSGGSAVTLLARPWLSLLVVGVASVGVAFVLRQPTRRPDAPA